MMNGTESSGGNRESQRRLLESVVQLMQNRESMGDLVESIHGLVCQEFGVDRISILLHDPASGGLVSDLQLGLRRSDVAPPPAVPGASQSDPQPASLSVSGICFAENRPVIENDCSVTPLIPQQYVEQLHLKSTMALPIPGDCGPIGVLRVDDLQNYGRFKEQDAEFFGLLARVVASVIAMQRTTVELKETSQRLGKLNQELESRIQERTRDIEVSRRNWEAMASMAAKLVEADTTAHLARIIRDVTIELFGWDAFIFSERISESDDFLRVLACDTINGQRVDLDNTRDVPKPYKTRAELHRGEPLLIHNPQQTDSELNRFGDNSRISACLLYVPISIGGRLYGILSVQSYTVEKWSESDLALLQSVGGLAAPAMRRVLAEQELQARLHELEAAYEEIRRKNSLQEAIYHVAESVRTARTLDELFPLLHSAIRLVLPAENFFIALHDKRKDTIRFPYAIDENDVYDSVPVPMRNSMTGMVIRSRKPMLVDQASYERLVESGVIRQIGHVPKSWLGVPLMVHGNVIGAMVVQSYTDPHAYGPEALSIMSFVSTEIAGVIEFKRADDERRTQEERYRLAIDQAGAIPYERDLETGGFAYLGDGIAALTGYTRDELTREIWDSLLQQQVLKDELAELRPEEAVELIIAGKLRNWKAEYLIHTRDGQERWLADSSIVLCDSDGKPTSCLGLLQDITGIKRSSRFNDVLSRLGVRLSAARTPREVAEVASDALLEIPGWDTFFLDFYNRKKDVAYSVLNLDTVDGVRAEYPSIYQKPQPPTETFRRVMREGALLISSNPQELESLAAMGASTRRSASRIFVPIRHHGDEIIGTLSVQSYTADYYSSRDVALVQAIADHCSAALDRTQAEEKLRTAERNVATFGKLAHQLSFVTTAKEAGKLIAEVADDLIGLDAFFLDLYDKSSDTVFGILNMDTIAGKKQVVEGHYVSGPPTVSERRVLAEGAFLLDRAREADRNAAPFMEFGDEQHHSASLMYAPARKGDDIVAFMSVQSYTPHAYTQEHLELLQALADHCAGVLEHIRLEESMRLSEERYALAARGANDGLWDWDLVGGTVYFSPRWKAMFGFEEAEIGTRIEEWFSRVHSEDLEALREKIDEHLSGSAELLQHEHRIQHKDGRIRWMLCRGVAVRDAGGRPLRIAGSLTDITKLKESEAQLLRSAFYDPLTGLANRALFMDRLSHAVRRASRSPQHRFAVMFFDLDRFKLINDTLGHHVGDGLLKGIAVRLFRHFRGSDTVARLGGDEFTVLLEDIKGVRDVIIVADRVLKDFTNPFLIEGNEIHASVSLGIATNEPRHEKVEDILKDADAALYRAKRAGRGRYEVFDETMRDSVCSALDVEAELRDALVREEFELYYQPIFELNTVEVVGFEALIRWNHPAKGLVEPKQFIPVAEECNLVVPIGEWVLREACRQIADWRGQYEKARECYVSVNISARQFASKALTGVIEEELARNGLPASSLHLELTETALQNNPERVGAVLARWREMGMHIMLDDFGTGYSSLTHLNSFPVDCLKIDRSFVSELSESTQSQHIVRAVISLAGIMRMKVIAEGAEAEEHVRLLKELRCDFVQGFLLAAPRPANEIERFLK
ncbi:MAG: hypothetical protein PWP23_770 [Candidatus Sumerlaeota bacterium]|nr:hypothetical protein [Candidatus Sumerlaeota bacterium]